MAVNNSLSARTPKLGITAYLNRVDVLNNIGQAIGDMNKQRFVTSIISAVNTTPALQECSNASILAGALLGETLKLSPSPQLGQYYLVPFKQKAKYDKDKKLISPERTVAQFQLGYKGYIQLAIRSGQYKKLNVLPIKEGELISFNPLDEEIEVQLIENEIKRENAATIGYYAMFEYTNGFKKAMYWSREKMESHAEKYSMGYKAKKGYTFWEKDFDSMACKTMLRQLISKWGIMSIDLQNAYENDMAVIHEDGTKDYIDNEPVAEPAEIIDAEVIAETTEEKTEQSENTDAKSALFGK